MRDELASRPVVRDELARGTAVLAAAGIDSPRLDAELLLARVLGVGRAELVIGAREPVAADARAAYERLLDRRRASEPLAYLVGEKPFRRLWLTVDRRVLIPRPETELLVEVGLALPAGARVLDVGTGSGAIALALADERADLVITGIELDAGALAVARANGERLGLEVRWVLGDLLGNGQAHYDAVLANLPYVANGCALAPEVGRYEPALALFAGPDGLAAIRRLVVAVSERPDVSLLALEVGAGQADAVAGLLADAGFDRIERRRDLAGHERVVLGRR